MGLFKEYADQDIAELEATIRRHQRLYYDMNEPEITDAEFDRLWEDLKAMAPDSPVLNERSQDHFGAEHKHAVPMGSLSKVKTTQELLEMFDAYAVTETPKIDGASLSIHYSNHRLVLAATRGRTDTGKGKIVTTNVSMIPNIPKTIDMDGDVEIRGEACILRKAFYGIMDQPGYDGLANGYANPRNAASGGLTCRDPEETRKRNLTFVAYKIVDTDIQSHADQLKKLASLGFTVPPHKTVIFNSIEDVESLVQECAIARKDLPYDTDGMVVRFDLESVFQSKGVTGVCPNGAAAYKFDAVQVETTLVDIEWETGRLGFVHPTGVLEPVQIDGSKVSRCTLNNISWMKAHGDPVIGSKVVVQKCGDIIPGLVAVTKRGTGPTNWPSTCPSCGSKLSFAKNTDGSEGVRLKCWNKVACPAQFVDGVINMLVKLEIKGIKESAINRLVASGLMKRPWDIFGLTQETLEANGWGKREAEILVASVTNVTAPVPNILAAVGVDFWGRRMVKKLMRNGPQFVEQRLMVMDFNYDELVSVPEVGPAKARALADAFSKDGYGTEFMAGMLAGGVSPVYEDVPKADSKLSQKTFLITGTLSKTRKMVEADIVAAGGSIASGVSKTLGYLVVGEDPGSKVDKAEKAGVTIISESQLYSMISG
jgi:DNA ligase (NAD+)